MNTDKWNSYFGIRKSNATDWALFMCYQVFLFLKFMEIGLLEFMILHMAQKMMDHIQYIGMKMLLPCTKNELAHKITVRFMTRSYRYGCHSESNSFQTHWLALTAWNLHTISGPVASLS